jgi:hypothetical protein
MLVVPHSLALFPLYLDPGFTDEQVEDPGYEEEHYLDEDNDTTGTTSV